MTLNYLKLQNTFPPISTDIFAAGLRGLFEAWGGRSSCSTFSTVGDTVTGQLADKPTRGQITRGLDNSRTFNFYRRPRGDDSRKKGTPSKRAGVRTPWTPHRSAPVSTPQHFSGARLVEQRSANYVDQSASCLTASWFVGELSCKR